MERDPLFDLTGLVALVTGGSRGLGREMVRAFAGRGADVIVANAMTRSLAAEYAPSVRVNTLAPGPFLTDIAQAWTPEMRQSMPNAVGRPGRPEEIVTAALFLASPASSFVNGGLLRVDGGFPLSQ